MPFLPQVQEVEVVVNIAREHYGIIPMASPPAAFSRTLTKY